MVRASIRSWLRGQMPKRTVAFGGKVLRFDPRLPVDCQPLRARILGSPGRATPFAAPARENPAPADGRRIRRHYQPVGWLEESRVEEIAVLSWRLRRLLRWESGMTARALATNSYNLQESKTSSLEEPEAVRSSSPEMDAITEYCETKPRNPLVSAVPWLSTGKTEPNGWGHSSAGRQIRTC